jgi:hypothetical protein|tara:strand:- start:913 stop:1125 length:213 start_codon:yes stop_codon:yes gene_type:complete
MIMPTRRQDQLTLKLNDTALALIEEAGRRSPTEATSLVELATLIDEIRTNLETEERLGLATERQSLSIAA